MEHWPKRKKKTAPKHPCAICETRDHTRKYRNSSEWFCLEHWPKKKARLSRKKPCKTCGTLEATKRYWLQNEWYCLEHWPAKLDSPKVVIPRICQKCQTTDDLSRIQLSGQYICQKCAKDGHVCLVCGDEMVEIGKHEKHYICVRQRKGGHKNDYYTRSRI